MDRLYLCWNRKCPHMRSWVPDEAATLGDIEINLAKNHQILHVGNQSRTFSILSSLRTFLHPHSLLMFLLQGHAPCLSPVPRFSQQVWLLKTMTLKSQPAVLTSPELNPLAYINILHLVHHLCFHSKCLPAQIFILCYALYQQRRINVSLVKPGLFCSQIFLSLVSFSSCFILFILTYFLLSYGSRLEEIFRVIAAATSYRASDPVSYDVLK